jgi:phosphatidylserine/phosphatidylglycerophosphate/cardiolipin synthase-like enzyme
MIKKIFVLFITLYQLANPLYAAVFPNNTSYDLCFTPGQNCTQLIVNEINKATQSVNVQAYSFTSAPIAKAIVDAKKRGINVIVILDKSQVKNNQYSSATYFQNQKIPLWIDSKPAIAHNKVIIIDKQTVITGSFNFTKAAQEKNAENVLIIHDPGLAKQYYDNWKKRESYSYQAE